MKNKIKFLAILGALTIFLSFSLRPSIEKRIIVIDAGHGGKDLGANIDGQLESKIVETISKKISLLNNENEVEIVLLRDNDRFIELRERVERINKINPSLLISLHVSASKNVNENGVFAYVSNKNEYYIKSLENAKGLVDKISGDKLSKGEVKDASFYVISKSKCPAFLLEVGYLSNEKDKNYITSEIGQNEIANKIFEFIKK